MGLRNRPDAEVHAQHLGQQITHLALGEVVARAQRADARQGSRADLAARHACGQIALSDFAAARAPPAVEAVLVDLCLHGRNVEDLVAQGLAGHLHRCAAITYRGWQAVNDPINPGFIDRWTKAALVALLGAPAAFAGAALGAVTDATGAGAIGGRRLGRIARIQP